MTEQEIDDAALEVLEWLIAEGEQPTMDDARELRRRLSVLAGPLRAPTPLDVN